MRYVNTITGMDIVACVEVAEVVLNNQLGRTAILSTAHVNALQVCLLVSIQMKYANRAVACVEVVQVVPDNQLGRTAMLKPAHANVLEV